MIKILKKLGINGTYLGIIKATYNKPMTNLITNKEKLKAFPLKLGPRQIFPFSALTQHNAWSQATE